MNDFLGPESITAQGRDGYITIPTRMCRALGVNCEDYIWLHTRAKADPNRVFLGRVQLKSGTEVYDARDHDYRLRDYVKAYETIDITVARDI